MKKVFKTTSATATVELGRKIGSLINEPCVIAFCGGMGSGKTCFTTGFVKGLDYYGEVSSPTFAIVNEYLGGRLPIYHFDMYRIQDEEEATNIGFDEILDDKSSIKFIEWPQMVESFLPKKYKKITIVKLSKKSRNIILEEYN